MIKVFKILITVFFSIVFSSCNKQTLDKEDYTKYVESMENGLKRKLDINGWEYTIQYKPLNFILVQENLELNSARANQLKGTIWFTVKFRYANSNVPALKINITSLQEYNQRLHYYLEDARKDIKLEYGNSTLFPVSYLFETNYGLTPEETMVLGFVLPNESFEISEDLILKIHDRIFKNGIIKTTIDLDNIKKIPQLKLK